MIRTSCLLLLLTASNIVLAQPLYKWVEPDGAITFSPTQPPSGVTYEIVNDGQTTLAQPDSSTPDSNTPIKADADARALRIRANTPALVRTEAPRIKMTPSPGNAPNGQTGNAVSAVTAMSAGNTTMQVPSTDAFRSVPENSSMRKQRQCQDLRKRVISLERRLKSRLTPEDMDNTVIHMARYQRSYDQHCAQ